MIAYDLTCGNGHTFEGWFEDSAAFASQKKRGLVACPVCNDTAVQRLPSRFAIKSSQAPRPRESDAPPAAALAKLTRGVAEFVEKNGWIILPEKPLALDLPRVEGLRLTGGKILTPEFMALTSGLVLYTSAFIGEVVRAGIQSVSKGQVEASRALGLNAFQSLRLVVFPQALRVIVPPLTSQYLNLIKNSSLAVVIGYADLFFVGRTIINQAGQAVPVFLMIMGCYLAISLLTSAVMNVYNRGVQLVER